MLRILFVIPYLEVEQSVKQVFQEVASLKEEEISYDIRLAEIGGHLDIENDAADIIIARGFTAASIKTSIPKIELQVSAFDIMQCNCIAFRVKKRDCLFSSLKSRFYRTFMQ